MNKALRTTLALVVLISAAANAPGLLLALGNSEKAEPAAKAGSTVAPVDYYAYDYDYDTTQLDPGEWLDTLFQAGNGASVASWHHTWTDFESAPEADVLGVYRRPAHWEPEGVLFAYLATFSDIGYTDLRENFAKPSSGKLTSMRLAALGGTGPRGPGPGPDVIPDTDPPPPPDDTPVPPPGPQPQPQPQPDTDPPPPVNVPEPASTGLFALGLAGLFMWGKRYRVAVVARDGRDRA